MGLFQRLFGPREPPEVTQRLTLRAMELLREGRTDHDTVRTLVADGLHPKRAGEIVALVHRVEAQAGRLFRGDPQR